MMKKVQIALSILLTFATAMTVGCGDSGLPVFNNMAFISNRDATPATRLFVMTTDGANVAPVPFSTTSVYSPSVSFDLKMIGFESNGDVWVSNPDGSAQTQLTTDGNHYQVKISPDGTKILFNSWDETASTYGLWIMKADGTGALNLTSSLVNSQTGCYSGSFSADSKTIVFSCYSSNATSIYTVKADGAGLKTVYTQDQYCDTPAFSPDGKKIFFVSWGLSGPKGQHRAMPPAHLSAHRFVQSSTSSFDYGVVSIDRDGSNLTVLAPGAYESEVLNKTLYYTMWNSDLGAYQIYGADMDGTGVVAVTDGSSDDYLGLSTD